jgi:LuxR family maltose regulon positive regulatory protein
VKPGGRPRGAAARVPWQAVVELVSAGAPDGSAAAGRVLWTALRLAEVAAAPSAVTARQRAVLLLLAGGASNRAIARQLGISENTVKHHLKVLRGKLGVATRLETALWALRHLGAPEPPPGAAARPRR